MITFTPVERNLPAPRHTPRRAHQGSVDEAILASPHFNYLEKLMMHVANAEAQAALARPAAADVPKLHVSAAQRAGRE